MATFIKGKKSATRQVSTATGVGNQLQGNSEQGFLQYLDDDAVLNSNLKQLQDGVFEVPIRLDTDFDDGVSKEELDNKQKQLDKVLFAQKVKEQYPALWHNGNMYFEMDVIGNRLIGLYPIDAYTMEAMTSDEGVITEYKQSGAGIADITFPASKIFHIKAPSLRTGSIGKPLLTPLKYPLARKVVAENFLSGMIANLQPLIYLNLIDSQDSQVTDLQNELRAAKDPLNPLKIITLLDGEKVGRVDTGTTTDFNTIFEYIDRQNQEIIRVVQIPPIVAGTTDNSNRSNSEIQERAVFGRTANAWQMFFIEQLQNEFLTKVGWEDVQFEFPNEDERKQEAALVKATKLKDLGYSQDAIHKVLIKNGIKIEDDFEEVAVEGASLNEDLSGAPSRQPRPKTGIPQNEEKRQKDVDNKTKKVQQ